MIYGETQSAAVYGYCAVNAQFSRRRASAMNKRSTCDATTHHFVYAPRAACSDVFRSIDDPPKSCFACPTTTHTATPVDRANAVQSNHLAHFTIHVGDDACKRYISRGRFAPCTLIRNPISCVSADRAKIVAVLSRQHALLYTRHSCSS